MSASEWTAEELALKEQVEDGFAVVISKPGRRGPGPHKNLYEWAKASGLYQNISRPPRGFTPPIPAQGTASSWGNPYKLSESLSRDAACGLFEDYLQTQPQLLERVTELRGKVLGCSCSPLRCHGDYLAKLANRDSAQGNKPQGERLEEKQANTAGVTKVTKETKTGSILWEPKKLPYREVIPNRSLLSLLSPQKQTEPASASSTTDTTKAPPQPRRDYSTQTPPHLAVSTRLGKHSHDLPDSLEPQAISRWLEPRPGEPYSEWSERFDRADRWAAGEQ